MVCIHMYDLYGLYGLYVSKYIHTFSDTSFTHHIGITHTRKLILYTHAYFRRVLQEGSIQPLISLAYSKSPDDRKNACNAMANLALQVL